MGLMGEKGKWKRKNECEMGNYKKLTKIIE